MANTRRNQYNQRRVASGGAYIDGNTVRRLQPEEQRKEKPVVVSQQARRNREKATSMSLGFVVYLMVVCTAILFTSINYLQLKSEITEKASTVTELETEYSQLKADNDAYYSQVSASADLEKIKAIAIKRLGMKYAAEDQIVTYETEHSSYVRQYQDVPDAE